MRAEIEYEELVTMGSILEVDDVGNVAIIAKGALGEEYYMVIKTHMGEALVFQYGPICPDIKEMPKAVSSKVFKMNYNDVKLKKVIKQFLNDPNKMIVSAETVDDWNEVFNNCRDIAEWYNSTY